MASRRDGKQASSVVPLPRLNKSQSAPQLQRPKVAQKQGTRPQPAAQNRSQPAAQNRSQPAAQNRSQSVVQQGATLTCDAKRRVMEALADPHIEVVARSLYRKYVPDERGLLGLADLRRALLALTEKLRMPAISSEVAESMMKRFDVNGDGSLSAGDFYELFVASLRRVAFDQSSLFGRNIFVTKQSGKVWDTYKHIKKLGTGSFATTYLCQHRKIGDDRVVKAVEKSRIKLPVEDIEKEIMVMLQLDHPHIVRLYEWYEGASTVYLVLDALKGGTLREVVLENYYQKGQGLKEEWIQTVIRQVVEGMSYCHSLRLIHKDLKDENIMLLKKDKNYEKPFVVIIDLGVAEMFPLSDPRGNIVGGTPATMAPEVWMGNFGPKCDVWSVGCVAFELLAGAMPFTAMSLDPKEWCGKMRKGPDWRLFRSSEKGRDLCERMLTFSDSKRPSMKECLEHEWFAVRGRELQKVVAPQQFAALKEFTEVSALSRSLLFEIASRLPMERAEKIVQIFEAFDLNRDGNISKDELSRGFASFGMKDQGILESTFKALDVDQNGTLSFSEFAVGVLLMFKDLLESRFRAFFKRYDKDSDGMLSRDEVESFLANARKIAKKEAGAQSNEVMSKLFPGNAAKVGYEELRKAVLPGYG